MALSQLTITRRCNAAASLYAHSAQYVNRETGKYELSDGFYKAFAKVQEITPDDFRSTGIDAEVALGSGLYEMWVMN